MPYIRSQLFHIPILGTKPPPQRYNVFLRSSCDAPIPVTTFCIPNGAAGNAIYRFIGCKNDFKIKRFPWSMVIGGGQKLISKPKVSVEELRKSVLEESVSCGY